MSPFGGDIYVIIFCFVSVICKLSLWYSQVSADSGCSVPKGAANYE